jgi:F-type H+-transporting ATPase subunit b
LKRQYEGKLTAVEGEREQARVALHEELQAERERRLAALRHAVEEERKKHDVLEAQRVREQARAAEQAAVDHSAQFAARLLGRIASPEVEARLVDLFLEELARQSDERSQAVRQAFQEAGGAITVSSAYPLEAARRAAVTEALGKWLGFTVACQFTEDRTQLAGLRVIIGPWILEADLQRELKLFTESAQHGG